MRRSPPQLPPTRRLLALRAGALWLGSTVAVAAAQPPQQPPVFSETVDVRVVNLEVVVTDRDGRRVEGLDASDFELLVDGESTPIEYFNEVRGGLTVERAAAAGAAREVPSLAAGEPAPTSYLVFIDELFSIGFDRDRVIDRMIEQLPRLGGRDRMAVVRYDGRELEMLTPWTDDRRRLEAVLVAAKGKPSLGLQRFAEQRRDGLRLTERDLGGGLSSFDGQLDLEERYYVGRLQEQIERVVTAAASTLRSLPAPGGRRVMLLLSGGWPFDPAEYVVDDPRRPITETRVRRGEQLFQTLSDTANLLGYTLYPVDVPGLQASGISAAAEAADARVETLTARSFTRESGIHQTLQFLSRETGGVALINAGRDQVLETVSEDLGSYYWLGFTPQRAGDDKRHRLQVRVRQTGLKVRSRQDFFDFSRQREITLAVESALYFGAPPSPNPLQVRLGKGERAGLRTMTVPLFIGIPADAVTFLPGPNGFVARVELRVAVLDKDGATADTPVIPLFLQMEEKPEPTTILGYETQLKMRRKPHDLVIAVYDLSSGNMLSSAVEVQP